MACPSTSSKPSDGDGRVLRGRRLRAHLRSCSYCRAFRHALQQRPADLAALAPPLPMAAAAAIAAQVLGVGRPAQPSAGPPRGRRAPRAAGSSPA